MSTQKRLYQLWPSKNRFFLNGKLITGPTTDSSITISLYIIFFLCLSLYIYFIFPIIISANLILCIGFFIMYITTITFMLLTSLTDPGIIPTRPFLELQQQQVQQQHCHNYNQLLSIPSYQRLIYLLYENSDPSQIFCCSCHIYRPSSASHCSRCDACYLGLDHHCPWLGTCVAKNNYRTFLAFLFSVVGLMVVFGLNVLTYVNYETSTNKQNEEQDGWTFYVVVCCVIVGGLLLVLVGFFVFHIVLLCKGKTTRQYIKDSKMKNKEKKQSGKISKQKQSQQIVQSLVQSYHQAQQQNEPTKYQQQQQQTDIPIQPQKTTQQKPPEIQQQFLDNYINSLYRQTSTFYQQLFQSHSSIHLVNFRQQLKEKDYQFVQKGLNQLQEKKINAQKQTIRYSYHKHVISL